MRVALDANCFIDASNPASHAYSAMTAVMAASQAGAVDLAVSRQTLHELEQKPDAALHLARSCTILPHYPVGSWDDQVAPWGHVAGTWIDARENEAFQTELKTLAKSGNDIRDRGALVDAFRARVDAFVTSDAQLVGSAPATRIGARFGLRILRPDELVQELRG